MSGVLYIVEAPEITTDDIIQDIESWARLKGSYLTVKNGNRFIGHFVMVGNSDDLTEAHKIARKWLDGHIPGLWEYSQYHHEYGFSQNPYLYSLKGNGPGISPCLVKRIETPTIQTA